jgi:hypothetical protein
LVALGDGVKVATSLELPLGVHEGDVEADVEEVIVRVHEGDSGTATSDCDAVTDVESVGDAVAVFAGEFVAVAETAGIGNTTSGGTAVT